MISGENGNPKREPRIVATANSTLRIFQVPARTLPGNGAKCTPWTKVTTAHAATAASPWRRTWRGIYATSVAWRPSTSARTATSPLNLRKIFTHTFESIILVRPCASGDCIEQSSNVTAIDRHSFIFVRFRSSHPLLLGKCRKWKLPLCEKENSIKSLRAELPSSLWSRFYKQSKSRNRFSLMKLTRRSRRPRSGELVGSNESSYFASRGLASALLTVTIVFDFRCCQKARSPKAVHLQALQQTVRLQEGPEEASDVRLRQIAALQVSVLRPAGQVSLDHLQSCASDTSRDARDNIRPWQWHLFRVNGLHEKIITSDFQFLRVKR